MTDLLPNGTIRQEASMMRAHVNQAPRLRLLIGSVVAILLGSSGIAVVKAWGPGATGASGVVLAADKLAMGPANGFGSDEPIGSGPVEGGARTRAKCAECGVVEFTREIAQADGGIDPGAAGKATRGGRNETDARRARNYEVLVRINDGSNRVLRHETSASWRAGERLIFIEGANLASN